MTESILGTLGNVEEFERDTLPVAYWVCCPELTFIECGGAALGKFGLSRSEVLGRQLREFFRNIDNSEEVVRVHVDALEGTNGSFATTWSGNAWHCSVSAVRRGGEVIGVTTIAVDYTADHQRVVNLEDRCRKQRIMMDQAPVFLMHADYLGRLTMANAPALEWLSVTSDEAEFQPLTRLLGGDLSGLLAGAIEEASHGGTANLTVELDHSGESRWFETTVSPGGIGRRQGRGGYVLLMVEVTERVLTERHRLQQAERLTAQQRLESLGMMAAGVAHDFNNLLAAIVGHAGIALMENEGQSELREHLTSIDEAAKRASDLCRQLMLYSGDGELTLVPLSLYDAIRKTLQPFHGTFSENIELRVDIPKDLPLISGNVVELRRMFTNLFRNGLDAMTPNGGIFSVRAVVRRCSAEEWEAAAMNDLPMVGEYVVISVSDTGCGMDETVRSRLFEPFFTTKADGHGLGVASVLGAVRSHGGTLRVETREAVGTTFFIYLPVDQRIVG